MAKTESRMLPLGTEAPTFALPDASGKVFSLDGTAGSEGYLIMFICNHCPFVKHLREEISRLANDYAERGIAVFAINSNDAETYPGDSPEKMKEESAKWGYRFPYLVDADQSVALAYKATCTPDFFLFNGERKLVYRGQLDGSRPANRIPVDGSDLRAALDALLAGDVISAEQIPSIGCSIKWKLGNAPA